MTKVVLSIELPGRQKYSQKECEQDKNKEETTYMNLLVHNKKGIRSVPECLFCGDLGNGVSIFRAKVQKNI